MQVTPQITFRDVKHSPDVEEYINDKIKKLEQFSSHLVACQVVISGDSHHQNGPNHFETHIKLSVPKKELVSTQSKDANLYKSIDGAFSHIKRQLDAFDKKMTGR